MAFSGEWSLETELGFSADRVFKASLDWPNIAAKVLPSIVVSAGNISGEGDAGSVRHISFDEGKYYPKIKERIDYLDAEKFEFRSSVIEGGAIGVTEESRSRLFKIVPKGPNACTAKITVTTKYLPGADIAANASQGMAIVKVLLKAIEEYLVANPNAYTQQSKL